MLGTQTVPVVMDDQRIIVGQPNAAGNELLTRTAFQNALLPRTITEAQNVPFYVRHWRGCDVAAVRTIEDLPLLPLVNRQMLQAAPDFLKEGGSAALLIHSSGTTGAPFIRYRGRQELDAVRIVALRLASISGTAAQPRVVFSTIADATHGGGIPIPTNAHSVAISVNSASGINNAVDLLLKNPLLPGVEDAVVELQGRPRHLAILARELLRKGRPFHRERVERLTPIGYSVTPSLRRYFERAFPMAVLRETYSLSEAVAGAERCHSCGGYHTDAPLVCEIVTLDGAGGASGRTGRLVLTELHPFSELQPLIRYDTGDIVREVESSCDLGLGFEFVGRMHDTPLFDAGDGPHVALSTWKLTEVLEDMPAAARSPLGNRLCPPYDVLPMGPPFAEARIDQHPEPRLHIDVGVAFSPALHPSAAAAFESELLERLTAVDPDFAAARQKGVPCHIHLREVHEYPRAVNRGK